jgi:hypothetical protein
MTTDPSSCPQLWNSSSTPRPYRRPVIESDFVFHDQGQQLELRLQQKLAHTISQLLGDLRRPQDHLNRAMIVQQMKGNFSMALRSSI